MANRQTGTKPNAKIAQIDAARVPHDDNVMTTDQGAVIANDQEVQRAGSRGPALLQDFVFREKLTHFDHERIPERIVHARGTGAHGVFTAYEDMSKLTKAAFLGAKGKETPVFVRFSTVAGFRGSPDTVRDVRGFAVKFYTEEGNYDIVGNNMPVFFVQDAIKFPDLIHALKPEPNNEIPQAQSAHDTFWDFVSSNHECAHNMMWLMSDRAIPKSYRTMDGFGIHTFKFVNAKGEYKFVKLHWKSKQGVRSLIWDEAQKIAGKDPDFNRRDLWESIENGNYPEWELGVQILDPNDEFKFDFDILDCTKLWPEEIIPVTPIGKLTLNRNVTNFFAETEQVAFCPANLVPGIELSNDPMLQGRLFSYLDTQLSRLGGPNFHELPINKPVAAVNNNQRDGIHRMSVDEGVSAYFRNALQHGQPHVAVKESALGESVSEVNGCVIRDRANSFLDFYTQPSMFYNSMSDYEKGHIVDALRFELGKCKNMNVRQAAVDLLARIDGSLAREVAAGCGATTQAAADFRASKARSCALSMANQPSCVKGEKVAVLIADGFDKKCFDAVCGALTAAGADIKVIAPRQGGVKAKSGENEDSAETFATASSVLFDAVFVPCGCAETLSGIYAAREFVAEAYRHCKPVGACGDAEKLLADAFRAVVSTDAECCEDKGVLTLADCAGIGKFAEKFVALVGAGRHFERDQTRLLTGNK